MARAEGMEWNEILSTMKLKEEAYYLRVERRRATNHELHGEQRISDEQRVPSTRDDVFVPRVGERGEGQEGEEGEEAARGADAAS